MVSVKQWESIKVRYCDRAGCDVALEAEIVYPGEHLPDQNPRILSHRCSHGLECSKYDDRPTCTWTGNNPGYDPFAS